MKKKHLFMSMVASLFIAGCSQEEVIPNDNGGNGEGKTSYLTINLVSPSELYSRAEDTTTDDYLYEDGEDEENSVKEVRFYFFDENGNAVNVKLQSDGKYTNYYDWTKDIDQNPDDDPDNDIESKLSATIVINTATGDKIPQRIAAVLNPTTNLGSGSMGLEALQDIANDYAASDLTKANKFVMFNAVYSSNSKEVCTTPIEAKHLCKTPGDAILNPVTIYVERSVAKVEVTLDKNKLKYDDNNRLQLKDKDGEFINVDGQNVYLEFQGWDLTAETNEGRLVKKIDTSWPGTWWNGSYRSFWAINSKDAINKYYDFYAIDNSFVGSAVYTNENAELSQNTNMAQKHTKFIIKGKLCKEDGTPLTIVRHLGVYFADKADDETEAENMQALKESILNQLKAGGRYYYHEVTEGEGENAKTSRIQIDKQDIKIVAPDPLTHEDSGENCYVYAQLTDDAAGKTWYTSSDITDKTTVSKDDINNILKGKDATGKYYIDRALVWKSGMTYYYNDIEHLTNSGKTGVVRNHVYKANIQSIAGLGTPVYDPSKVIYPEKPKTNDHYIAAEINILSWRIVNHNYDLEW